MFKCHVHSQELAEVMKKVGIAIPTATAKGENDGVKMVFYKNVKAVNQAMCILLAFDGKTQVVSPMSIQDVTADLNELEIHVSGQKLVATASAYDAMDTNLELEMDKEVKISGAGNEVALQLGQKIVALKQDEPLIHEIEIDRDEFVSFVNFGASCYGEEKGSRGMHCVGIRIDEEQKKMIAVSSNTTRCAYAEAQNIKFRPIKHAASADGADEGRTVEKSNGKQTTVVVEGKLLKKAIKNLGKKKVLIGIDKKRLRIKCGTDVVMVLTQDIPFPMDSIIQVLEKCNKTGAWKAKLSNIFQALAIYEITMESPWLEISRKGDTQVRLQGKDEKTSAVVTCAQEGDIQNVAVDERELKNALSVFAKDKEVIIETISASLPLTIRQHTDDPNRIIVMPVMEE